MSPRNPLKEDTHPQEVKKGESITNLKTYKSLKMIMPDGTVRTFITGEKNSAPEQNGQVADTETTYMVFDPTGTPIPMDPRNLILSHLGLFASAG